MEFPFQKKQSSRTDIRPFTSFGSSKDNSQETYEEKLSESGESDYSDPSIVGLNFYNQYGAHDDRPLQLPTSKPKQKVKNFNQTLLLNISLLCKVKPMEVEDKKRPGEIRFGGMSFALPPPGTYPDIPKTSEVKVIAWY